MMPASGLDPDPLPCAAAESPLPWPSPPICHCRTDACCGRGGVPSKGASSRASTDCIAIVVTQRCVMVVPHEGRSNSHPDAVWGIHAVVFRSPVTKTFPVHAIHTITASC